VLDIVFAYFHAEPVPQSFALEAYFKPAGNHHADYTHVLYYCEMKNLSSIPFFHLTSEASGRFIIDQAAILTNHGRCPRNSTQVGWRLI